MINLEIPDRLTICLAPAWENLLRTREDSVTV